MFHSDLTPPSELVARIEAELHAMARHYFAGERPDHTLQPTALVSEVWLRLAAKESYHFADMTAFRGWASGVIRRILVDHARRKRAEKRGGGRTQPLPPGLAAPMLPTDLVSLDEALQALAVEHPRAARVVEMRFYGMMTEPAAARVLGISERTARYDWELARAWLRGKLDDAPPDTDAPAAS